jgi:hypothetical protein
MSENAPHDDEQFELVKFAGEEAHGLENHAKLVAASHGDKLAVPSRDRARVFRRLERWLLNSELKP